MTNLKTKLTTAAATGAVLLQAMMPVAFAQTSLTISGNGAFSTNDAALSTSNTVNVSQTNTADITNDVTVDANTGDNSASFNTGGDSKVTSGNATTDVSITNVANQNHADVSACCANDTTIEISDNGAFSENNVALDSTNSVDVTQENDATIENTVDITANTGGNTADFNTGGDSSVTSGNADTTVELMSAANVNSAVVGGGDGDGGSLSAVIDGNGAFSVNDIALDLSNEVTLEQTNTADITNDVTVDVNTGDNSASFNTGGDSDVVSGNADTTVTIDNLANFNAASIDDCGCLTDLSAMIEDNGAFSENVIAYTSDSTLDVTQDNESTFDNTADVVANTGGNAADFNTDGDSSVDTEGDSETTIALANEGNVNTFGDDLDVEFDWDLGDLWSMFLSML